MCGWHQQPLMTFSDAHIDIGRDVLRKNGHNSSEWLWSRHLRTVRLFFGLSKTGQSHVLLLHSRSEEKDYRCFRNKRLASSHFVFSLHTDVLCFPISLFRNRCCEGGLLLDRFACAHGQCIAPELRRCGEMDSRSPGLERTSDCEHLLSTK